MTIAVRDDWRAVAEAAGAASPSRPGVTATVVLRSKDGGDGLRVDVTDGRFTEIVDVGAADIAALLDDEAAVVLTQPSKVAAALLHGATPPAVAFMRGEQKFAGPTGPYIALQPLVQSDELATLLSSLPA